MNFTNPGFDPETVAKLKKELQETGMSFKIIPDEEIFQIKKYNKNYHTESSPLNWKGV
jgi:hypothetical protein